MNAENSRVFGFYIIYTHSLPFSFQFAGQFVRCSSTGQSIESRYEDIRGKIIFVQKFENLNQNFLEKWKEIDSILKISTWLYESWYQTWSNGISLKWTNLKFFG